MTIKKRNYFRVRAFPNLEDHYDDFIKYYGGVQIV